MYVDTKNDFLIIKDVDKISRVVEQNKVLVEVVTLNNINIEYIKRYVTPWWNQAVGSSILLGSTKILESWQSLV